MLPTSADDWARLLEGLDKPTVGQVREALADATDTSRSQAYERVEAALDVGELVEEDTSGAFPELPPDPGLDLLGYCL